MNIVEEYLYNNPKLKLSVKTIAKKTGLRTKQVTYLCYNSSKIRKVYPLEVGCLKKQINTFTYN